MLIQRAIDYLSGYSGSGLTGGTLYFPPGTYKVNLTLRSGVELIGNVTHGYGSNSTVMRTVLNPLADGGGAIIDSPAKDDSLRFTLTGAAVRGFLLDGQASTTTTTGADNGILLHSALKITVEQCAFQKFNGPAIKQERTSGGTVVNGPLYITNCFAQSCCLSLPRGANPAQDQLMGVFDLRGVNGIIRGCECGVGAPSKNLGRTGTNSNPLGTAGILITGADWQISDCLAELSDYNYYFGVDYGATNDMAARIQAVNITGDQSYGHNFYLDACTESNISGLATRSNVTSATSPYNAVHVVNHSRRNKVAVHVTNWPAGATSYAQYGVYEELNNTDIQEKNDFTRCSVSPGSAAKANYYNGPDGTPVGPYGLGVPNGSPMPSQLVYKDVTGTIPDVNGCGFVRKTDNTHLNDMVNGTAGQRVSVLFTGGVPPAPTPRHDGSRMFLNGSSSRSAQPNEIITFKNFNGAWYEEGGGRPIFNGNVTVNPGSIAKGSAYFTTVTVTGANLDDFAFASLSNDPGNVIATAQVVAANTVRVAIANLSATDPISAGVTTVFARAQAN